MHSKEEIKITDSIKAISDANYTPSVKKSPNIGKKIFIGMLLGVAFGFVYRYFPDFFNQIGIKPVFLKAIGTLFINMIKMIIIPLVFVMIASSFFSVGDLSEIGKMAKKALVIFFATTILSALIGLFFALYFKPGIIENNSFVESFKSSSSGFSDAKKVSLIGMITDMIPSNIFQSFYKFDIVHVVFFAILFSIVVAKKNKTSGILVRWIDSLSFVMQEMIAIVMKFAPYGVFSIMMWLVGTQDLRLLSSLSRLFFVVVISILTIVYVLNVLMVLLIAKLNPLPFIKKMFPVQMMGAGTGSSAVTLPTNIDVAINKLGVTGSVANFLMPLGTTLNMNGSAASLAIYTTFIFQLYGIDPTAPAQIFLIVFMSVIGAIGTPPIPGGAIFMLSAIVATFGLPLESIGIILALDKIAAMFRVFGNVTSDASAALVVDKLQGTLNEEVYYSQCKK